MSSFDRAAAHVERGADQHEEARALVAETTDDELLGCLDGDLPFWARLTDMVSGGYAGDPAARTLEVIR